MAWTGKTFNVGDILTAAQMNNLQADITAQAQGDAGAPAQKVSTLTNSVTTTVHSTAGGSTSTFVIPNGIINLHVILADPTGLGGRIHVNHTIGGVASLIHYGLSNSGQVFGGTFLVVNSGDLTVGTEGNGRINLKYDRFI